MGQESSIVVNRRRLKDLYGIRSHDDFHQYLITQAVTQYIDRCREKGQPLGSVLALCANEREAKALRQHPFEKITITGVVPCPDRLAQDISGDQRLAYERQNAEKLTLPARSYDLVLCKEGLHHLARPILGFYEMLRVTRSAAVFIEPYQTPLVRMLESTGLASSYERSQIGNIANRDNFVFRWDPSIIRRILNSYYLDSGYQVTLTVGWMTSKLNGHPSALIRLFASTLGWLASFMPFAIGNYATAFVVPGKDLPPD